MPKHYWRNLPEAALIPAADRGRRQPHAGDDRRMPPTPLPRAIGRGLAQARSRAGTGAGRTSLDAVARAGSSTAALPACGSNATQTVFGEGPADARIMFVGEQPGDQEDLAGRPFVGPAGQAVRRALDEAGIDRELTLRHQRGEALQVRAARQAPHSQEAERAGGERVRSVVATGAAADRSRRSSWRSAPRRRARCSGVQLPSARIGEGSCRGMRRETPDVLVTVHPSYLLRVPPEQRDSRVRAVRRGSALGVRRVGLKPDLQRYRTGTL